MKRTLRLFGNALGNSVYDKQHLKEVKESKATMPPNPIPASGVVPQQQPILGTQVAPVGVSPVSQNQPTSTGVRLQNPPPNRMPQQQGFGQILPSQQNQQPFHQQQQHPVGQPKPFQPPNGQFSHFRGSPQ